ncbi:lectin-like domain-containing protein [Levilactobacillus sp. HBUAS70063]|uniref:lectin-like domain-containing protein n=1 Tax=Levilactobacillus sp. HBUAS70063 TaxID=3109359 RepID=UPI003132C85C
MKWKTWLGVFAGLGVILLGGGTAHADTDYDNALKAAPQGISLENIFTPGTTTTNQAAVVDTPTAGTQAAKVNNGKKQFGALWSTADNAFDLTKNETASMWLYFGNNGKKAADGMALVLQNDDNGLAATPTFGKTVSGETLGVWGVDTDKKQATADKLAASAIQNSWALEFDTHLNSSTNYSNAGSADSFDGKLTGPHLAYNYPGEVSTYQMVKASQLLPLPASGYYATQTHEGAITGDYTLLSNGAWHHLTLDWDAAEQQMTYTFNDKDPATGHKQAGISKTVAIDLAKIDPENTGQVRWGFTGATGDSYENNLVVMEKIPGLVNAQATTKLTDVTTNQVVGNGDVLKGTHQFRLDYRDGKQSWKDVAAAIQLPTDLTYDDSATIHYQNGQTSTVNLAGMTDNQVAVTLTEALNAENATATISFTGTADDLKAATTVAADTSRFTAVNGVVTADTPSFTVTPTLELNLFSLSGSSVQLESGEDAIFKGLVVIPEGVNLHNTDMTVNPTLNGQAQADFTMAAGDDNSSGRFNYTVQAANLKAGANTLKLNVEDPYGNVSNTVTYTINVPGQLLFQEVSPNSSFESTSLTGQKQTIKRTKDWQVKILDTREAGAQWSLQVAGTKFTTADGRELAGDLYYYDSDQRSVVTTTPMTVMSGTSSANDDVTDVVGGWDDEAGLMLEVNSDAVQGQYDAQITWSLNNVP